MLEVSKKHKGCIPKSDLHPSAQCPPCTAITYSNMFWFFLVYQQNSAEGAQGLYQTPEARP